MTSSSTKKYNVLYITMTASTPHDDHFRLLKACKDVAEYVIVGLVTDELGFRQKGRYPLLSFSHRRSILENSQYVNLVVEHTGESKCKAYDKLHFDVLASSDEYFGSSEHEIFREIHPEIPQIFIPKNSSMSSSSIDSTIAERFSSCQILSLGVNGYIMKMADNSIIKTIHIAKRETNNTTADTFKIFSSNTQILMPRNFKRAEDADKKLLPCIAGVNPWREVSANKYFKGRNWCLFQSSNICNLARNVPISSDEYVPTTVEAMAATMARERAHPAAVVVLKQRNGGITLTEYARLSSSNVREVVSRVKEIIKEINDEGFVHGDIHPNNVLVSEDGHVSIIDFGWVSARHFKLCPRERDWLEAMLREEYDLNHFIQSLHTEEFEHIYYVMQEEEDEGKM